MQVGPKRKRRRRNGGVPPGAGPFIPAAEGSFAQVVTGGKRRRRRRGGGPTVGTQIGNGGQITLTRSELFLQVVSVAEPKAPSDANNTLGAVAIAPGTGVMPFLWKLAQCYTRLKWNSLSFEWKPAVGTTTNGILTYGVRLMDDRKAGVPPVPATRAQVSSLYPVNDHAVWCAATLRVNNDLLMSRKWYATEPTGTPDSTFDNFDYAPGSLEYGLTHDADKGVAYGEFWVTYSVTLDGTRSE